MYSRQKAFVFGLLGLAFGCFCHRLTLLYDSLTNAPPMETICLPLRRGVKSGFQSFMAIFLLLKNLFLPLSLGF